MVCDESYFNCTCPVCGKRFHLKPYKLKRDKIHHCSRECFAKAKKEYMAGEKNHQFGLKGNKNATWKSDERVSKYGYIQKRVLNHPLRDKSDFVFEHRLIAEEHLLNDENSVEINGKRYLSPEYDVHHKNFNRQDNRVENLQIMTKKEHRKLHAMLNPSVKDKKTGRFKKDNGKVKIKRVTETAIMPKRMSDGAAGFDLHADISEPVTVAPHETIMLKSGVAFEIPKYYAGLVFARSGISTRFGLRPATCVSVIDSDYRGEVGLPIHNDSDKEQTIEPYERVAQMVISPVLIPEIVIVDKLSETERGENGFGSSGR